MRRRRSRRRGQRRTRRGGKTVNTLDVVVSSSPLNARHATSAARAFEASQSELSEEDRAALGAQRRSRVSVLHTRASASGESIQEAADSAMTEVDESLATVIDGARGRRLAPPIYRRVINISDAQTRRAGGRRARRRRTAKRT